MKTTFTPLGLNCPSFQFQEAPSCTNPFQIKSKQGFTPTSVFWQERYQCFCSLKLHKQVQDLEISEQKEKPFSHKFRLHIKKRRRKAKIRLPSVKKLKNLLCKHNNAELFHRKICLMGGKKTNTEARTLLFKLTFPLHHRSKHVLSLLSGVSCVKLRLCSFQTSSHASWYCQVSDAFLIQRFADNSWVVWAEVKLSRLQGGFTCTCDCPGISRCWQHALALYPLAACE